MPHMQQMLVAGGFRVALSGAAVQDVNSAGASATITFTTGGSVTQTTTTGGTLNVSPGTDWVRPSSASAAGFEIQATLDSGTVSGVTGSWLDFSIDREWQCLATTGNQQTASLTIQIRLGSTVLGSGTYSLDADAL